MPNGSNTAVGDTFFYRVAVYTNGTTPGLVHMTDVMPTYLDFVADPLNSPGIQYNATTREVRRLLGDRINIPQSSPSITQFKVRVNNNAAPGTNVVNVANIRSEGVSGGVDICETTHAIPPSGSVPPGPMCVSVSLNSFSNPPILGQSVSLTCGLVNGATSYEFRYKIGNGSWNLVPALTTQLNKSEPFAILESGTYTAQCRLCVSGRTCQPWEFE